ncbi:MAG: hypothetical protein P4L22_05500 [Candidatus Babeliales bacterium]|nr:hypothetical protein [Candidatus Babeliales bacterium]
MIKKLRYLGAFLIIFSSCMGMDNIQMSSLVTPDVGLQVDPFEEHLYMVPSPSTNLKHSNNSVVPVNNNGHYEYSQRDLSRISIIEEQIKIILSKVSKSETVKFLENGFRKNREGIILLCSLITVLLLHYYYAEVSPLTFSAQKFAGLSIAQYCAYKRMNLLLMAGVLEGMSEGIYLASLKWNFYTGLSTVCDIAALYSFIRFFADNLFRKMIGKNKHGKEIELEGVEIIPTKYKKQNVSIEEVD